MMAEIGPQVFYNLVYTPKPTCQALVKHLTADPIERVIEKYASFLNNLEQWVDANMNRGDIAEQELIEKIEDSYKRSLQANIDHYEFMARTSQNAGDMAASKRYSLMARIYEALIK